MRIKTIIISILVLFICHADAFAGPPDWFDKLPRKDYEIIGYGVGSTLDEATANAKKEIAQFIQTHITSESRFEERQEDKRYSQKAEVVLKERTDVVLSEVSTIKQERKKEFWYVAVRYENLPFEKKFAGRLKSYPCKAEGQNRYLAQTPLIKSINQDLSCSPNMKLIRNHGLWYMSYDKVMLPLDSNDFEKLFISYGSEDISLIPLKKELVKGDVFSFTIRSKSDGFVSLLNVYESGEVFVITANRPIKMNHEIVVPDPQGDMELFAGLPFEGKPTYDLYIAFISNNRIDLSRIQQAEDNVEKDERHFKFDEVLNLIERNKFSTVLMRTRP